MTLTTLKQEHSGDDIRFLEELLSSLLMFGQALEKLKLATSLVDSDAKYDSRTTLMSNETPAPPLAGSEEACPK